MLTKTDIRQAMKRHKAACSNEERADLSRKVIAKLKGTASWQQARTVLLYHSLPVEVDTLSLIPEAVAEG